MRVFVAGATGSLGRPLLSLLASRGHEVVALVRSTAAADAVRAAGASAWPGDLFDASSLVEGMRGADAVVRVATRIPAVATADGAWDENDRIRRHGTNALLEAAAGAGVPRFLQESVVWLARPPAGGAFEEASPPHPDRVTASALDAERAAALQGRVLATTLRLGIVYGPRSAQTRTTAEGLRAGWMPAFGDAPLSFLHEEDAASAFVAALERGARGTFHVASDTPTTNAEFLESFADALKAAKPRRVAPEAARAAAGPDVVRLLTTPMLTSSARLKEATGWRPAHPSPLEGIRSVARALGP